MVLTLLLRLFSLGKFLVGLREEEEAVRCDTGGGRGVVVVVLLVLLVLQGVRMLERV